LQGLLQSVCGGTTVGDGFNEPITDLLETGFGNPYK